MALRTTFSRAANQPALVLFWPVAKGGLWDPNASAMIECLEDELEVFVTCVGSGRGALGLSDAAAAARFMGCSSVVVVSPENFDPPRSELEAAVGGPASPVVTVQSHWSTAAVANAYREACRLVPRAA